MSTTNRYRTVLALFAVAFVLLAACSSRGSDDGQADTPTEATPVQADPVADTPVEAAPVQTAPVEAAPVADTSTSGGGQNNNPAPPAEPTPPAGPAPTIDSFDTPENIDCHNGNSQTFTASWTTTNATEVVISIDGAGPYGTYEPNGSTSLPFDCSNSHTFVLTARSADGQEATTSVTLDPRNVVEPQDDPLLDDAPDENAPEAP